MITLKEENNHLSDENVYTECGFDPLPGLQTVISEALSKIKRRGDINEETLKFFDVAAPRLGRFYLLPKIHKRLHSVPGRPVISNCSYYTENISRFLDFTYNQFQRKLNHILKIPTNFFAN